MYAEGNAKRNGISDLSLDSLSLSQVPTQKVDDEFDRIYSTRTRVIAAMARVNKRKM